MPSSRRVWAISSPTVARLLQPLDRWDLRVAAGGDDDAVGREHLTVNLDPTGPGDLSLALEDVDTLVAVARDLG